MTNWLQISRKIIHCVEQKIFRKLASIPFMLRRLSFLSTGFSTRCDDANEKSWALERQSELVQEEEGRPTDWLWLSSAFSLLLKALFCTRGGCCCCLENPIKRGLPLLIKWLLSAISLCAINHQLILLAALLPNTKKHDLSKKYFLLENFFCNTITKGLLLP